MCVVRETKILTSISRAHSRHNIGNTMLSNSALYETIEMPRLNLNLSMNPLWSMNKSLKWRGEVCSECMGTLRVWTLPAGWHHEGPPLTTPVLWSVNVNTHHDWSLTRGWNHKGLGLREKHMHYHPYVTKLCLDLHSHLAEAFIQRDIHLSEERETIYCCQWLGTIRMMIEPSAKH